MLCSCFALRTRFYHFPWTGINSRRFNIGKFCRVTRDQRSEETVLQKYQRGVEANLTHEQPDNDAVESLWSTLRDWRIGSVLSHWWIDAISAIVIGCRLATIKAMNTTLGIRMPSCDAATYQERMVPVTCMLIGCRVRVFLLPSILCVHAWFVLVYVGSHLRFQFYLTSLEGKGDGRGFFVCECVRACVHACVSRVMSVR